MLIDSLQFDHQVNILHRVPVGVREAEPFRVGVHYGRREERAPVKPPPAAGN